MQKLGKYLDVKRGPGLPSKFYAKCGNYIRLTLGNFNYPNGGFKQNDSKEDIYYTGPIKSEYILKEGDLITPLTEQVSGLLGETALIPESSKYIQNGDIGLVLPIENKLDKVYCYYLLSSSLVKSQLGNGAQQTKIRHTSPEKIKECIAPIPDITLQKKIGHILFSIDNQIKRNNDMVQKLQVLAHNIFNYLFSKETNLISLNDFPYIQIISPGIKRFDGKKCYIATADVEGAKINYNAPLITFENRESRANMQPVANSVWFAKMKNSIKHIYVTKENNNLINNYVFSTGFLGLKCDDTAFEYLIDYLKLPYFESTKDLLSHGATQQSINNEDLKSFKIHLPSSESLLIFHNMTKDIYCNIAKISEKTHQLTLLKNKLLPLLINGQLE